MIRSLKIENLLSFGASTEIPLGPLNVVIGPNGSGKSNLIEVIGLLQSAPRELVVPVREGGGIRDWLWKGAPKTPVASIEAVLDYPRGRQPLRHRIAFRDSGGRLEVADERIENDLAETGQTVPFLYFGYQNGRPMFHINARKLFLYREDFNPQQSILSQRKDPEGYPEVTFVGTRYSEIRIYREWNFGRYTPPRLPQPADLPTDFLGEDARNLGLVLNAMMGFPAVKKKLLHAVSSLYEGVEDVHVKVEGGTVQVYFTEHSWTVPATRLSDGTLRWIALLSVLLHPAPPPLVCIEEPELGLHPDLMRQLANLLVDASERTQLIVTTHSDALVDALSDHAQTVLVCEKQAGATSLRHVEPAALSVWLEKYTLGQLWRSGKIGGNP